MFAKVNTIAGRITLLVAVFSALLGAIAAYYIISHEFESGRKELIENFEKQISATHPQQQIVLHFRDNAALKKILQKLFDNPDLRYIAAVATNGNLIVDGGSLPGNTRPDIKQVRAGLEPFDKGLVSRLDPNNDKNLLDLTLPVFSVTSPVNNKISRAEFLEMLADPEQSEASHLVAYLHLGISEAKLDEERILLARNVIVVTTSIVILSMLITLLAAQGMTRPLKNLVAVADDVADGRLEKIPVAGSREVKEIAMRLNQIFGDLAQYKTGLDVDNRMLALKVDERNEQLSSRENELNEAKEKVNLAKTRIRTITYSDNLTSLPNRAYFNRQFQLLLNIALRENHILALVVINIDNFKRINDTLGFHAGDLLLKEVAVRLQHNVRDTDLLSSDSSDQNLVSRFGGDEFIIVLNKIDNPQAAEIVAKRILTSLSKPMDIEGHELVVTPSIGIALAPTHGEDMAVLLRRANTAVSYAKSTGKNNFYYYRSDMAQADATHLKLESELRKAIINNDLELHYQPQVSLENGEVSGAEVLVRWNHPERGYIPPPEFVGLAEKVGIIAELGDWILYAACRQMKAFQEEGLPLPNISVNVSAMQFGEGFTGRLQQILDETMLDPKALTLELTEGIMMDDVENAIKQMKELRSMGLLLSVDDFGTGYSSLSYLSQFPLNELKIDRSFVIRIGNTKQDSSLVAAIIAMGNSLNLKLVAEGVETVEQFTFLRDHGVKIIQGYMFSKPLPAMEFKVVLKHHQFQEKINEFIGEGAPA